MIVVSGCPRSGTSLMMLLLQEALGSDRAIGKKWPMEKEYDDEYIEACVHYSKLKNDPDYQKNLEETKKMNPNGFWECPWTTNGIQWADPAPEEGKFVKIVSQGLMISNQVYVDKVIMMVRHPWAVSKSHKDLRLPLPIHARNKDIGNINPDMFINVTLGVSKWIEKYSPEILFVEFEKLISDPKKTINEISDFIGEGDWSKAGEAITPSLKRNQPIRPDERECWDQSLKVYNLFRNQDYTGLLEYGKSIKKEQNVYFRCPRMSAPTNSIICGQCTNEEDIRNKFILKADNKGIDWIKEPCLWECGMNPDRDSYTPLTIEESIKNNHWLISENIEYIKTFKKINGYFVKIEDLDIGVNSNMSWGSEGNMLKGVEYKLTQAIGNPNIWQYYIIDAAYIKLSENKDRVPLDIIISIEKYGNNSNLKLVVEAVGAYGVNSILFEGDIDRESNVAHNSKEEGGLAMVEFIE